MIDEFDRGEVMRAFEFADGSGIALGLLAELAGQVLIDDFVGEGGFAGTGDAGKADEETEGKIDIELAEVVACCTADLEDLFGGFAAVFRDGNGALAGEPG